MTISIESARPERDRGPSRYVNLALILSMVLNGLMMTGLVIASQRPAHCPPLSNAAFAGSPDGGDFGPRALFDRGSMLNDDLD